jgi:hypothetical protein
VTGRPTPGQAPTQEDSKERMERQSAPVWPLPVLTTQQLSFLKEIVARFGTPGAPSAPGEVNDTGDHKENGNPTDDKSAEDLSLLVEGGRPVRAQTFTSCAGTRRTGETFGCTPRDTQSSDLQSNGEHGEEARRSRRPVAPPKEQSSPTPRGRPAGSRDRPGSSGSKETGNRRSSHPDVGTMRSPGDSDFAQRSSPAFKMKTPIKERRTHFTERIFHNSKLKQPAGRGGGAGIGAAPSASPDLSRLERPPLPQEQSGECKGGLQDYSAAGYGPSAKSVKGRKTLRKKQ